MPSRSWVLLTVLAAGRTSWNEAQIVVQSATTGERMLLIDGGRDARYLPTGHLAYELNNVLLAVPFDVDSRQVTGGPVPLVEGVQVTNGAQGGPISACRPMARSSMFPARQEGAIRS